MFQSLMIGYMCQGKLLLLCCIFGCDDVELVLQDKARQEVPHT